MTNWITLSKKVLERIGIKLTSEDFENLIKGNSNYIETLLVVIKPKLEEFVYKPTIVNLE